MLTIDRLKLGLAVILVALGIGAFYYLGAQALWVRYLIFAAALGASVATAAQTNPGRGAWSFAKEARIELRKVVWPTRKETIQMTLVVILMVVLVAAFLGLVDWALIKILQALTGQRL